MLLRAYQNRPDASETIVASSPFTGAKWTDGGGMTVLSWSFATLPGDLVAFASSITENSFQTAVRAAFDAWENVADIDFVEMGDSQANDIRLGWTNIDGNGGTLGFAHWRYIGAEIIEAEIEFDRGDNWLPQSSTTSVSNFYTTALHEIGHTIGLAHIDTSSSIMYAYQTPTALLSSDDIANVQTLYGAPSPIVTASADTIELGEVFRFYNPETNLHFFTASSSERDAVRAGNTSYQYEGTVFTVPTSNNTASVYRFFDPENQAHFYTASEGERDSIEHTLPDWQFEGVAYQAYVDSGSDNAHQAVHRYLKTDTGGHFFTTSDEEMAFIEETLPSFRYEGIAYYVEAA